MTRKDFGRDYIMASLNNEEMKVIYNMEQKLGVVLVAYRPINDPTNTMPKESHNEYYPLQ